MSGGFVLGNIHPRRWKERYGVELSEDDLKELSEHYSGKADLSDGRWHGFELPIEQIIVRPEYVDWFRDIVAKYSDQLICPVQVSVDRKEN